ncbi:DsbA family protein [Pseudomonas sp.]|jgi:putative protein-disulfide isomerase|uniref:DsbA family protein n=1 Tax=Pseudomonas sp. TaxID=306 RepID=UPI00272A2EFC|nr:DsbA family protein [Pseudomonas sp.]
MSQRLIYVMDPMCSWCWGFMPVIQSIRERAPDLPIHFVAGGLRFSQREVLDERTRAALAEHWQAAAESSGQPFADPLGLPSGFIYNTEPACRAMLVARELAVGRVADLVAAMQHAFYVELRDLCQVSVLLELASACGYDPHVFAEQFDAELTRAAVAVDLSWTRDLGIAGFPTLLAQRDGQLALLANGYQPAASVLPLLDRWLAQGHQG